MLNYCTFIGAETFKNSNLSSPSSKRRKSTRKQTESSKSPSEYGFFTQPHKPGKKRFHDRKNKTRRRSSSPARNGYSKRSRGLGRRRHTKSDTRRVAPLPSPPKHSNTMCVISALLRHPHQLVSSAIPRRTLDYCSIEDFTVFCTLGKVSSNTPWLCLHIHVL